MSSDDWKFLLAGLAIYVLPFFLFVLWTLVPMSERRVREWFAAYGRVHADGVPLVRERLQHVRWHRRVGALLGGLTLWVLTCSTVLAGGDGDLPEGLTWLPLVGYVLGAVIAELRAVRTPARAERVAELSPRRTSDYLASWVLPAQLAIAAASLAMVVAAPLLAESSDRVAAPGTGSLVVRAASIVVVVAAGHLAARWVVRAPLRRDPAVDAYLDDAFRQMAVLTCLAAASMASLALGSGAVSGALIGRGWWALVALVPQAAVALTLWVALRQPVPWTFGPRIRNAWVPAEADPVRPRPVHT